MKKYSLFVSGAALLIGWGLFVSSDAHAQIAVTLPSIPTSVSASVAASSQISVSWSASTESSGTIEGYYVYRNGARITTTAGTSFTDAGISSGFYNYTVAAYDANNNVSAQSSPASVTLLIDTTPPSVPTGVTISGQRATNGYNTATTLTISWNPSTDNVGVLGYNVYRNGLWINSSTAITGTSVTDAVFPGQYSYTVDAYDAAQNFSDGSSPATVGVYVDTILPSTPSSVSVQQTSGTGVTLSWASSTDSVGIAGYQIFQNGTQIATATGAPYAITGLSAGGHYVFAVAAYDNVGNISAQSSVASITLQATNGPTVPAIVSAGPVGTSSVSISWAIVVDPLQITSYNVYRDGTQIGAVTSTSYLDQGLATGTYAYGVSATDISGAVSAISSSTNVTLSGVGGSTPPGLPYTPPTGPIFTVSTGTFPFSFTQSLYFGLRSAQVQALQSLLVGQGYLSAVYATGFFGNITLHALEQFQCAQSIACTGAPGWGLVGPKTRAVLNQLEQGGSAGTPNPEASTSSTASAATMLAEIQALQAELANLQKGL
jgi:fibronectin type 3 domain-containing protein